MRGTGGGLRARIHRTCAPSGASVVSKSTAITGRTGVVLHHFGGNRRFDRGWGVGRQRAASATEPFYPWQPGARCGGPMDDSATGAFTALAGLEAEVARRQLGWARIDPVDSALAIAAVALQHLSKTAGRRATLGFAALWTGVFRAFSGVSQRHGMGGRAGHAGLRPGHSAAYALCRSHAALGKSAHQSALVSPGCRYVALAVCRLWLLETVPCGQRIADGRLRLSEPQLLGDVEGVDLEVPGAQVCEVALQCLRHAAKGDLLPGNVRFVKKLDIETFFPRLPLGLGELPPVKEIDLIRGQHVDDRVKTLQRHFGTGFFTGLPKGAHFGAFANFHKTRGQGPQTIARLDRPLAQQNLLPPGRYDADDVARIFVLDVPAGRANRARTGIAFRHAVDHRGAAGGAMAYGRIVHGLG